MINRCFILIYLSVILLMSKEKSWGGSTKSTNLFNSSSPHRNDHLLSRCQDEDDKELIFLKGKNQQLQERILRMTQHILELQKQKKDLLKLNARYVETLNLQFKNRHATFEEERGRSKGSKKGNLGCKHCDKSILDEFEKDYRSLVKHSMTLEQEIKSKNQDLAKLDKMRRELKETKHDSIGELVAELVDTTILLVSTRKNNNYLEFQNQKLKREQEKIKNGNNNKLRQAAQFEAQNQNFKSLINTIQNQSMDRENKFKTKIYELEVTVEKLEQEVRTVQKNANKQQKREQDKRAVQVETVKPSIQLSPSFKRSNSLMIKNAKKARLLGY